ncbi:PREDICTED: probable WRKY transcription factor 53 [Ipomoea nil]|uniref:probable WRKY transcription factor 53 n=1 Tax=Ipomoea nil TaxID=35883 RepID=UPI000900A1D5|nr:PREDICTED: probable WRKY transcription factor 53 [Ipomoea nil]
MENFAGDRDLQSLITELANGREAATQLQMILNAPSPFSSETRELLVHNVLASYDKALGMLNYSPESTQVQPAAAAGPAFGMESPSSFTGSPHSEDSDREHDGSRKRNAPRWTQKVQVCPGSGLEGHLDDGYSWRKYGQKDILGARYPRGYYRCTYRHAQGCLATKQVQRSDEDPTIFDITYRGRHTCNQGGGNPNPPQPPQIPPQNQEPTESQRGISPFSQQGQPSETLLSFCRQLRVETSNLDNTHQENQQLTYLYSFPSSSDQSYSFRPPSVLDGGNFSWSISPSFGSPASTSESSDFGRRPRQTTTEAQPTSTTNTGIIPAVSAANSPAVDPGFAFGTLGFDSNFTFDSHGFFPNH